MLEQWHRNELPRATLIGLALADRNNKEPGPAEVEVLDIEPGDLGRRRPEANVRSRIARSRIAIGVAGGP
jgi:hypothetical protein